MNNYIRKMLIGIFTMLFLLTGCSSESKNDPEEQDSENSGQSQIRVE
jgi:predicted component of type VI protein secretion system